MRVVTRTFMLALVALALVPSGARAQTSEKTCRMMRLIAIGKAAQCQSGAIAKYCASTQKEEDIRTRVASIAKCDDKLIDGYMISARRSNYSACDSPVALAKAIEAVDGSTQTMMRAAETAAVGGSTTCVIPSRAAIVSNGKGGTYTDNGNGTVTDSTSGLVWEKKTHDGSIHDVDNIYTWMSSSGSSFNGTAATVFLATLNTAPCFAGSCAWRLPTIIELSGQEATGIANGGIVDLTAQGCGRGWACINAIFGPTRADGIEHGFVGLYWSSSTYEGSSPYSAWSVDFQNGSGTYGNKTDPNYVRAVRTGP